nr:hypothetical protein [Myxococcota bacterium]
MSTTMAADETLHATLQTAWELATSIDPALGTVVRAQWTTLEAAIERLARAQETGLDELAEDDVLDAEAALAGTYLRAAAVAIAAGEEGAAHRWFDAAEELTHDADELHAVIVAARRAPERFRTLVH